MRRWRFRAVGNGTHMVVFGGHRLWHGYAVENSLFGGQKPFSYAYFAGEEEMISRFGYAKGGYLDDMWIFTKSECVGCEKDDNGDMTSGSYHTYVDNLDENNIPDGTQRKLCRPKVSDGTGVAKCELGYLSCEGFWSQLTPQHECFSDPGELFDDRGRVSCRQEWPLSRASHGMTLNYEKTHIYVFGGYRALEPYPHTFGAGAGPGAGEARQALAHGTLCLSSRTGGRRVSR